MARKRKQPPTEPLLPFAEVKPVEMAPPIPRRVSAHYQPSEAARAAFERLEGWLCDPATGKPVSAAAEETLYVLNRALLDGKNGYWHVAEDRLEALLASPPSSVRPEDEMPFRHEVDDALECLHERLKERVR
jgi:hypothetical protein